MTKRTSTSYVCTLDVGSCIDMELLATIRKTVQISNYRMPNKKRVVIRGRKPIAKTTFTNRWTGKSYTTGYDFAGNVIGGIKNASMIDVYIYDRRD